MPVKTAVVVGAPVVGVAISGAVNTNEHVMLADVEFAQMEDIGQNVMNTNIPMTNRPEPDKLSSGAVQAAQVTVVSLPDELSPDAQDFAFLNALIASEELTEQVKGAFGPGET